MEECACHGTGGVNQVQCILLKSFFPINFIYIHVPMSKLQNIQIYYTNVSQDETFSKFFLPKNSRTGICLREVVLGTLHYTTD